MRILVTGGKGFIGSKIVETLSQDHKITVVDNNDTYGLMPDHELDTLMHWRSRFLNKKNVLEIRGDVLDRLT